MKTEELKQNVKGYVHQFEDGGLRLLRKGQKGVIHTKRGQGYLLE